MHGIIRKGPTLVDGMLVVMLFALTLLLSSLMRPSAPGSVLEVKTQAGEERLSLDREGRYPVSGPLGTAYIIVEDRMARLENAPCPLKICERMGPVGASGQTILCLPNRISVRVLGKVSVDAVSR
ncbi:MAG: NusG domain II-containing protein [bacterium]|nr:MAG: NusG domain II-containing protein [bacterium]